MLHQVVDHAGAESDPEGQIPRDGLIGQYCRHHGGLRCKLHQQRRDDRSASAGSHPNLNVDFEVLPRRQVHHKSGKDNPGRRKSLDLAYCC